jgi:hypothetical protein
VRGVILHYREALIALLEQDAHLYPIQRAIRPDARGKILHAPEIVRLEPAAPAPEPAPQAASPVPVQESLL